MSLLAEKLNKLLEEENLDVQSLSTLTGLSMNKLQEIIDMKEIYPPAHVIIQIANVFKKDPIAFLLLSKEEYDNAGILPRIIAQQGDSIDVVLEFCLYVNKLTEPHYKFAFIVNKEKFLDFVQRIEKAIELSTKQSRKIPHENEPLVKLVDYTRVFIDEQKHIEIHIIEDGLLIDFRTFFIHFPLSFEQKEVFKLHIERENAHVNLHIGADFMRKYESLSEQLVMASSGELVFRENFIIQQIRNMYSYPVTVS
ncbi:hypothetical protein IC805_09935 [Geobacillus thermoleovorans]|uniref:hypothetical protein n=1 Tax=Geobacillus thermoleovorans TaxID=33941 RepID=UPI0016815CB0|nr:hypothetical protein [Geobacillus thermoleovorans]QNU19929.1 hypothetical protein IC805_09935 [Geobacillus thermoleovorans]